MNTDLGHWVGIDIGGTKTLTIITDSKGRSQLKKHMATSNSDDPETFVNQLMSEIESGLSDCGGNWLTVLGMGIGVPGITDRVGMVKDAPSLGWHQVTIAPLIRRYFDGPLYIDNDVNVAALGEQWQGAAMGKNHFFMVTVGTGIGSAIVINKQLYRGFSGSAGEIGYFAVNDPTDWTKEDLRKFGRFENETSGSTIGNRAREVLQKDSRESVVRELVNGNIEALEAKHVLEAAVLGDLIAWEILETPIRYMAMGIANAISLLNPEIVIIGGGVADSGELYVNAIRERVERYTPIKTDIVNARLGNMAGAMGAIAGVRQMIAGGGPRQI